jgi:hypothetical protein
MLLWLWCHLAVAGYPNRVSPSAFAEYDGVPVLDAELLQANWRDLVKELGTVASNKPVTPARTLGTWGWEVSAYNQFIFTEAKFREDGISPWARADPEGNPPDVRTMPTVAFRKGLPLSAEVGANFGWLNGTNTGVAGGFGRVAVLEGYHPAPDVSLQLGYSGYVGNDEIELGVLDLSVTLGTTVYSGRIRGINTAQFSPYATFSSLRISASPKLPEEAFEALGLVRFRASREENDLAPIILPQFGGGFQIAAQGVHLRFAATWAPATVPAGLVGLGFNL